MNTNYKWIAMAGAFTLVGSAALLVLTGLIDSLATKIEPRYHSYTMLQYMANSDLSSHDSIHYIMTFYKVIKSKA